MKCTLSKAELNNRSILLAAILLLGLFFRLYDLSGESLWLDEVLSIKYAHLNLSQIIIQQRETPPLYYIVLHWWIRIFGYSELSIRFPSVICGFFSMLMMYKMGQQLFNNNTGKIGALLLAFSVLHIQYSQEARAYNLSVLLTLLSMYYFIQVLKEVSYRNLIGYVLSSTLLIYSHIYGLFIIISQNIYFISLSFFSKEARSLDAKKWLLIQSLLVFLFVPWVSIFLNRVAQVQKGYWIPKPHISTLISSFTMYSSGSRFLLLLFLTMLPFSIVSIERIRGSIDGNFVFKSLERFQWKIRLLNIDKIYFLLIWLITPIIFPFIISKLAQPIYLNKYTIVASSAFYLLVARGLSSLHSRRVKSITVGIVIIVSLLSIRGYYAQVNKEQWIDVAEYIDAYAKDNDILLVSPAYYIQPFNYYDHRDRLFKRGFPEDGRKDINEKDINKLFEVVANYKRVWLILSETGDEKGKIAGALNKSYDLSHYTAYKGIKLYLFEKGFAQAASRPLNLGTYPTMSRNSIR